MYALAALFRSPSCGLPPVCQRLAPPHDPLKIGQTCPAKPMLPVVGGLFDGVGLAIAARVLGSRDQIVGGLSVEPGQGCSC